MSLCVDDQASLEEVAQFLTQRGKGLLASDESNGTIGKRLVAAGFNNNPETRRRYRQLFYGAEELEHSISGAILFKETLYQSMDSGETFVNTLKSKGILPGIKIDEGLTPLPGCGPTGETRTKGLDGLDAVCAEYRSAGARFAKWRAALHVHPSQRAVEVNASELAQQAAICQAHGLVPIVEPELLIDGDHSIDDFEVASLRILTETIATLWRQPGISLEATLLKPQMIVPGAGHPSRNDRHALSEDIARRTLRAMRHCIPPAIPGIMFLSGGQSEEEATINLNTINQLNNNNNNSAGPWALSFSYGRGLQASVLKLWSEKASDEECMKMAVAVAEANGLASRGEFNGKHPSITGLGSLQESFRGWRTE